MKSMSMKNESLFYNRDLSWLHFNLRVLHQAESEDTPLLERLRFLSIYSSNLDEFFMKRVGYIHRVISGGVSAIGNDQVAPGESLRKIQKAVLDSNKKADKCFVEQIKPQLAFEGINLLSWDGLSSKEVKTINTYFDQKIFPLLTPLAVDLSRPFPFISNLSTSLGVNIKKPGSEALHFARIKIPEDLPAWINVSVKKKTEFRMLKTQDLIIKNLHKLFPNTEVVHVMPFRVTRSVDVTHVQDDMEDMMDLVETELRLRKRGEVVRLEVPQNAEETILELLRSELDLVPENIYTSDSGLFFNELSELIKLPLPKLKFDDWQPLRPSAITAKNTDLFSVIREKDLLVHHPFESFHGSVERFLNEAVDDPDVLAIKITLYRAGKNSPIIPLLIRAAEAGKQVVCVIELKARFDEEQNIYWGEMLEKAGVHVVYGLVGLKVHSKMTLVVRKEQDAFRYYGHVSTGNYNSVTAGLYTDVGLFTADKEITSEMLELFNYLTGHSLKKDFKQFLVSPINMRESFLNLIDKEIRNAAVGRPARIIAKMNSLEDKIVIKKLYEASSEGVKIDLIVRGFCSLKPGIKDLSENITVTSIIGRFLEHSRFYYFRSGAEEEAGGKLFMGSADWMKRNLSKRFETIVPIKDEQHKKEIWNVFQMIQKDRCLSWDLTPEGKYKLRKSSESDMDIHRLLMQRAQERCL